VRPRLPRSVAPDCAIERSTPTQPDNPGFKDFIVGDVTTKHAVVVFTNGDNGRAIYERIVRSIRGDEPAFLAL
jgi:hypothetical protein